MFIDAREIQQVLLLRDVLASTPNFAKTLLHKFKDKEMGGGGGRN